MSAVITAYDQENYRGEIKVSANDKELCQVQYGGSGKQLTVGTVKFQPDMKSLRFEGAFYWKKGFFGKVGAKGSCSTEVLDITPLMQPLRDATLPWSQRIKRFMTVQDDYPTTHPQVGDAEYLKIQVEETATESALNSAERRLGYALPKEHRELLSEFGPILIEDSFMTKAENFQLAYDYMRDAWETPEGNLRRLPPNVIQLLKSGTILYTQVGDGYAALVYLPPAALVTKPATDDSVNAQYYWISQDEIVRPRALKNHDGTYKNYSQAMAWLLGTEVVQRYDDEAGDVVSVDFTCPAPLTYLLECMPVKPLSCRLRLDWERFE